MSGEAPRGCGRSDERQRQVILREPIFRRCRAARCLTKGFYGCTDCVAFPCSFEVLPDMASGPWDRTCAAHTTKGKVMLPPFPPLGPAAGSGVARSCPPGPRHRLPVRLPPPGRPFFASPLGSDALTDKSTNLSSQHFVNSMCLSFGNAATRRKQTRRLPTRCSQLEALYKVWACLGA